MLSDNRRNVDAAISEPELVVRCYSGYSYTEKPVSFVLQGINHIIRSIEDAWIEPGQRHFILRNENNQRFHLCYDETQDRWSLFIL
jgi:hypothetical protein